MPSDPQAPSGRHRFGDFVLDRGSHELLREGRRIRLQEKSFLVLAALIERPGEVVRRDELIAALWPKDHFVDAEHGLNTAVRRLRQALGDSAEAPRFVETLPKLGYRLVAAVERAEESAGRSGAAAEPPPTAQPSESSAALAGDSTAWSGPGSVPAARASVSRRLLVVFAIAGVLAIVGAAWLASRNRGAGPASGRSTPSSASPSAAAIDQLLARARYLRNHKRFEESRRFVEEALKLDPRNAEAVSGLALGLFAERQFEAARAASLRAIELDPTAWEAHRVLGNLALRAGDFAGAENHYRDSVQANPADSKSRNRLARHLLDCGRLDEARAEMTVSQRLAPDDPDVQNIWIQYALLTGDYEGAIREGEIWMAIWGRQLESESVAGVQYMIALANVGARRLEEALARFRSIDPDDDLGVALALGYLGRSDEARAILAHHASSAGERATAPSPARVEDLALAYIAVGDFDQAFLHLERLVDARWHPSALNLPLFGAIRADSRWPAFAERLDREFHRGKVEPAKRVRPERF